MELLLSNLGIIVSGMTLIAGVLGFLLWAKRSGKGDSLKLDRALEAVPKLESADQRQAYQLSLFAHYHEQGIFQSRVSFACSLSFAALGFMVIIASLGFLLLSVSPDTRLLQREIDQNREAEARLEVELARLRLQQDLKEQASRAAEVQYARTKDELSARASGLEAEFFRLSSQTTGNVEPLSLPFNFDYKKNWYGSHEATRSRLAALQLSARERLLKTSLAAVTVFPEHEEFLRDNITIFHDKSALAGAIATNLAAYLQLLIPTNKVSNPPPTEEPGNWRNLRRFVELVLRTSSVEAEVKSYLQRDQAPANQGTTYYGTDEVAAGMMAQLESLVSSLDQLHRNLELQGEFKLNPALLKGHQLIESSNRVRLQEIRKEAEALGLRMATNGTYTLSSAKGSNTNDFEDLNVRLKAVRDAGGQLKAKLGLGTKGSGQVGTMDGQGTVAILGVIAGTVIDAIAALFFVQSNRARELMVQFFDRLRRDRKLDEALGLAQNVPDPTVKSSLLRELSLLLATETPTLPDRPAPNDANHSTPKE